MSAFEAYKDYVALKNHFTKPSYDYLKYNGKTGVKHSSFVNRKDKIFFEKLAKRPDYHDFLIANLSENPKLWIRDLAYSEEADKVFVSWKKRQQSLTYNFKREFWKIFDEPKLEGYHPAALRLYLASEISLETLCIFVNSHGILENWDSKLEYDPIWEEIRMKIVKYTPFIRYDKDKMMQIMIDVINNE
jgi:hypothetical protein